MGKEAKGRQGPPAGGSREGVGWGLADRQGSAFNSHEPGLQGLPGAAVTNDHKLGA